PIYLPTVFGNVQQPSFGYQAVKEREQDGVVIGFVRQWQCQTDGFRLAGTQESGIIGKGETILIFRQQPCIDIIQVYFSPSHALCSFPKGTAPTSCPKRASTWFTLSRSEERRVGKECGARA